MHKTSFIENVIKRAKTQRKTIVLPESTDIRVLEAASKATQQNFVNVILIGNENDINKIKGDIDLTGVNIVDPLKSAKYEEYVRSFYELRKEKGVTIEKARDLMKDYIYFGVMMVKSGDADGLVSGAIHSSADTLRPALQILKTKIGTKFVSAFFVMCVPDCEYGDNGNFIFSDCGLMEDPTAEQLAEIAIVSSKSTRYLLEVEPKVAMLSYSTKGSANSILTQKVIEATQIAKVREPELSIDGELQLDAAIVSEVASFKAPGSSVAGKANTMIFPNLDAGNIGYKLVQRLAKAEAYGPITQGIAKPVNDLSRGCSVYDILGVIAITCVQAQQN